MTDNQLLLFVSRKLPAGSQLRLWAKRKGYELVDRSLLKFAPVPYRPLLTNYDWVFFYSARAVSYFFLQEPIFSNPPKFAVIGTATERALRKHGRAANFTGSGLPRQVAEQFGEVAADQTVLFPQTAQSRRSVEKFLGDRIHAVRLVVYRTQATPLDAPLPADVVILTSPLNAKAWLEATPPSPGQYFITLGPSTAAVLIKRGINCVFPPQPTEAELLKLLSADNL